MTPEEKSLLEKTHKLAEENNKLLHGLRRSKMISAIFRVIYWGLIIVVSISSYYFIEPYMKMLPNVLGAIQGDVNSANTAMQQIKSLTSSMTPKK